MTVGKDEARGKDKAAGMGASICNCVSVCKGDKERPRGSACSLAAGEGEADGYISGSKLYSMYVSPALPARR